MVRRMWAGLAAILVALGVSVAVPSGSAQAVWQCRAWTEWPSRAYSVCDYGLGGDRVVVDCWRASDGQLFTIVGPWQPAGQNSLAICGGGYYVTNHVSYQTF